MIACHAIDSDSNSDLGVTTIFYDFSCFRIPFARRDSYGTSCYSAFFFKKRTGCCCHGSEVPDALISSQIVVGTFRNCKTGIDYKPPSGFPGSGSVTLSKRVKKLGEEMLQPATHPRAQASWLSASSRTTRAALVRSMPAGTS